MSQYFDEGEKAEIEELYIKDNYKSVRELAKIFKVSACVMRYFVDYKGEKEKRRQLTKKWIKKNPEKHKAIGKRAYTRYHRKRVHRRLLHRLLVKEKGLTIADEILGLIIQDEYDNQRTMKLMANQRNQENPMRLETKILKRHLTDQEYKKLLQDYHDAKKMGRYKYLTFQEEDMRLFRENKTTIEGWQKHWNFKQINSALRRLGQLYFYINGLSYNMDRREEAKKRKERKESREIKNN